MRGNVLIYIFAFVYICGSKAAINYQPVPPFSVNFLYRVADFDNIVEPESENTAMNEVQNSVSEECPNGKCLLLVEEEEPLQNGDIKREEEKNVYVDKYFDNDVKVPGERFERDFQAVQNVNEQKKVDDDDSDDDKNQIADLDFVEEQVKAKNVTNATKILFDEIENPKPKTDENEVCCEEDKKIENKEKDVAFVKGGSKKVSSNLVEMHIYKQVPETEVVKKLYHKEPVLISLHSDPTKSKKYDFVDLLSKNRNKLVQVPAIRLTVVPEYVVKRRRSNNFEPFFTSRYRNLDLDFLEPSEDTYSKKTHSPKSFLKRKFGHRFHKRSSNDDNHYLRNAELLIQDVKASLNTKSTTPKNVPFNVQNSYKKYHKKEISNVVSLTNNTHGSEKPLIQDNNCNILKSRGISLKSNNFQKNLNHDGTHYLNSKMNVLRSLLEDKQKNKVDSVANMEWKPLFEKTKYENLLKTRIALMKGNMNDYDSLVGNEVGSINHAITGKVKRKRFI